MEGTVKPGSQTAVPEDPLGPSVAHMPTADRLQQKHPPWVTGRMQTSRPRPGTSPSEAAGGEGGGQWTSTFNLPSQGVVPGASGWQRGSDNPHRTRRTTLRIRPPRSRHGSERHPWRPLSHPSRVCVCAGLCGQVPHTRDQASHAARTAR